MRWMSKTSLCDKEEYLEAENTMCQNRQQESLTEKWAVWILAICTVCLFLGVSCFIASKTILMPKVTQLEIRVLPDSLSNLKNYSRAEVDSLITMTKATLDSYRHHFETVSKQKEEEDSYKSLGVMLLGAIIGLFGFFGYRSFNDIRDRGRELAKEEAKIVASEEARRTAKEVAVHTINEYFKAELPGIAKKQFNENFKNEIIESVKQSVDEIVASKMAQLSEAKQIIDAGTQPDGGSSDKVDIRPITDEEIEDLFDAAQQNA